MGEMAALLGQSRTVGDSRQAVRRPWPKEQMRHRAQARVSTLKAHLRPMPGSVRDASRTIGRAVPAYECYARA